MDEQQDRLLQIEREKIEMNNAEEAEKENEQEGKTEDQWKGKWNNGTKEECGVTEDKSSGKGIGEGEEEKVTHSCSSDNFLFI